MDLTRKFLEMILEKRNNFKMHGLGIMQVMEQDRLDHDGDIGLAICRCKQGLNYDWTYIKIQADLTHWLGIYGNREDQIR